MDTKTSLQFNRRELIKMGGAVLLGSVADLRPTEAFGALATRCPARCFDGDAIEVFPTSPLIGGYIENGVVKGAAFVDPLPIPPLLMPSDPETWTPKPQKTGTPAKQDSLGGTHQIWTSDLGLNDPIYYRMKIEVSQHSFTSLKALPIDGNGNPVVPPGSDDANPRELKPSTIYGFKGDVDDREGDPAKKRATFPGPRVNAEYGKPVLIRFENHLDENPDGLDRGDFGSPAPDPTNPDPDKRRGWQFLTHLHNAHTAPESDGNPNHLPDGYCPGEFVDNLYLNHPPDCDDNEKQSFLWFHDHFEGHTGANVYKGLVGLYPIYDPKLDRGNETEGLRLPGVRKDNLDGTFVVHYDIPLALYDCRLDDGVTPHKDCHNGAGQTEPLNWGKTFFRHFPNHGFVGDIFTVNGCAYPVLKVQRRRYRLRFLDASVARLYELVLMGSVKGPQAAPGTQGQYLLPEGRQCMQFVQIASEGGLLPAPILRNSIALAPAKRREVIVDFTHYIDEFGQRKPTTKGQAIYLVNVTRMDDGRKPDNTDPSYKVPLLKIEILEDEAAADASEPVFNAEGRLISRPLRPLPQVDLSEEALKKLVHRTFVLERGGAFGGETEWLINGMPFECDLPLACPTQGFPEVWTFKNGGGGWTHPMHIHQEEHRVLSRNGVPTPQQPGISEDLSKEDTIQLAPGEEVVIYRNFRTFTGKYVAHCHNLAHEDHTMMFGWDILPGMAPTKRCAPSST